MVFEDGAMLEFEVRNLGSYKEGGQTTGNHFFGTDGYYVQGEGFYDYKHKKIEVNEPYPEGGDHFSNFITAVLSRKVSNTAN